MKVRQCGHKPCAQTGGLRQLGVQLFRPGQIVVVEQQDEQVELCQPLLLAGCTKGMSKIIAWSKLQYVGGRIRCVLLRDMGKFMGKQSLAGRCIWGKETMSKENFLPDCKGACMQCSIKRVRAGIGVDAYGLQIAGKFVRHSFRGCPVQPMAATLCLMQ